MAKLVSETARSDGSIHRTYILTKEEAEAAKVESMDEDRLNLRVIPQEPHIPKWTATIKETQTLHRRRRP